MSLDS
ncbi:hypothetical protein RDI58_014246 [Solanum bulbocastanum]